MPAARQETAYNKIDFDGEIMKLHVRPNLCAWIDGKERFFGFFHEEIEIKYFFEGEATLLVGKKLITAVPGDIVFINPYDMHSTVAIGEQKAKYHGLILSLDFFEGCDTFMNLRHIFAEERRGVKNHIAGNSRAASIIERIVYETENKKEMYDVAVKALVAELVCILVRDFSVSLENSYPSDKSIEKYNVILPALNRIKREYYLQLSVDALAAECKISKYHFCRIFKEITGFTVVGYITDFRLKVADVILKTTRKSISEIATMCGFEDPAYFSRCYKKHKGFSATDKRAILSK